jgi:hypothetical protein
MTEVIFLLALAFQQQDQPGSIEGTIRAGGEPQSNIQITIGKQQTETNVAGQYSLRDIPPGRQVIQIGAPFKSPTVPISKTVAIPAGQTIIADFEVTRQASLSGTVSDEFDEPVANVEISLLGREYGAGAPRYFRRHVASTNDLGEYRIDHIRPDTAYLVLTQYRRNYSANAKSDALRRRTTLPTFYPGVADYNGATPVVLRPGEHREAIDLRVQRASSYCIEAQVAGLHPHFFVQPAHIPFGLGPSGGTTSLPIEAKPGADNQIRVCDLPPANYRVSVMEGDINAPTSLVSMAVTIHDRDITGLTLQPGSRLSVLIEVTLAGPPPEKPIEAKLRVVLQSMTRSFGTYFGSPDIPQLPASTQIENVLVDEYYHRIQGLRDQLYVKEILYGNESITYAPFRPGTQMGTAALRIVLGRDGAQIKARVQDRDGKPLSHATLVIMPAVFASEAELASALRTGAADQEGNYESAQAFAPGKYHILALTASLLLPLPAEEITRLIHLRNQAVEVTLEPNSVTNLNLEPVFR